MLEQLTELAVSVYMSVCVFNSDSENARNTLHKILEEEMGWLDV